MFHEDPYGGFLPYHRSIVDQAVGPYCQEAVKGAGKLCVIELGATLELWTAPFLGVAPFSSGWPWAVLGCSFSLIVYLVWRILANCCGCRVTSRGSCEIWCRHRRTAVSEGTQTTEVE